ncbi:MAG: hypothetical protein JNM79_18820 [Burkholderiales bacterium]|nr:hypothetical protein [Burkholderiales bacterium]
MKNLHDAFTRHPQSVGETWGQHAQAASGFAWRLQWAALAAAVHAIFPFLCEKTASNQIRLLHERMVTHRDRRTAPPHGATLPH